jgi:pilus assembly protein CpaC
MVLAVWAGARESAAADPVPYGPYGTRVGPTAFQDAKPKAPDTKGADAKGADELPQPRPVDPFADRFRLPYLGGPGAPGCGPGGCGKGTAPVPTEKDLEQFNRFVGEFIDPRNTIDIYVGRTRLMQLKENPKRVQMADESVASSNLVSPREVVLLGRTPGSTVFNLWFTDPKDKDKEIVLSYLIRVLPDPEARERLERAYAALQDEINRAFPDDRICLFLIGDKLVVTGQAKDIAEATQIIRIVQSNAPERAGRGARAAPGTGPGAVQQANLITGALPPGTTPAPGNVLGAPSDIVNLIKVPGDQQVMLKVTVAEINRIAARSIGINFNITNHNGVTVFAQNTGNLFNNGVGAGGGSSFGGGTSAASQLGSVVDNLPLALGNGRVTFAINALRNLNYARTLAEPNLVAMNGQTATFQAGGSFPVPVVTGFTGAGLQGVSFIPFGVQMTFTPYITDKDRIRLTVAAEVSTRDESIGANIGTSGTSTNVAGLNTRNFQTTVELREGETLAVAGLIRNDVGADATRVPFFGDLPLVGRFFAFDRTSAGEQELVMLVTPELVHPLEHKEVPPLPGSDVFEPGDLEFYLWGRLESRRNYDYRSQVRTDINRQLIYTKCEQTYIYGPHGFTEPPPAP